MRKLFVVLSFLVVASMLITACGATPTAAPATAAPATAAPATAAPVQPTKAPATEPPATEPPATAFKSKDPTTLTIAAMDTSIDTLDPALAYDTASGEIIQNTYDTLIFYKGSSTSEFVPLLASEMPTVSADGKVYTFKIRSGVKFHNGDVLTPTDVAYTFQRGLLQGGSASPQWLLSEPFFGVGNQDITFLVDPEGNLWDDREGLAAADPAKLVEACQFVQNAIVADDAAGTVTMTLAGPWGPFLATVAQSWGSIMDKKWVIENGGWDGTCDTWTKTYGIASADDPFSSIENGTGPFVLNTLKQGEEYTLERFDDYFLGPAKLQHIVSKAVGEWGGNRG